MKSFTRIGLPVLLVIGIVFGITFIGMYSSDDSPTHDGGMSKMGGGTSMVLPLNFSATIITPVPVPPSGEIKDVPSNLRHLYYWEANIEVGASGHYEFWCQNRNAQPVSVRVPLTNCQCAGVALAVVPPEVYKDYAVFSALANGPLSAAPGPVSAIVHALLLNSKLTWNPLNTGGEKFEQTIPAADPARGPQFALVRLGWAAKGEIGAKSITAELFANLPDGTPDHTSLQANTLVVPAFDLLRRDSAKGWVPSIEIPVGELRENGEARQEFFLASSTRTQFLYQLSTIKPDPCVTWSQVVPANEAEIASFDEFSRSKENSVRLKSLYKVVVTVRERTEVVIDGKKQFHQLDLGVLEHKLSIVGFEAGARSVFLKGRVLGDVTILSGAESGKLDLGNAIRADQDHSRDMILIADRPGLDLTLLEKEISPNYLKVKLEPLPLVDGRKKWRLRVTVPKESLYGSLPENSGVILQTNSPSRRRLTIPVRGMAFDAGGQKL